MVSRTITIALIVFTAAVGARGELELSPRPAEYELDGVKRQHLVFADGNNEVTYAPPKGWVVAGSAARLTLQPKDKSQAEASVTRLPQAAPLALDEEGLKKLTNEALASVPSGSTNVQVLSQEKNAVVIDEKETFLVTLSYTFYGENYGRSVMFMGRGNEQVRFQLTARLIDFKGLQEAFQSSLFSWQNL